MTDEMMTLRTLLEKSSDTDLLREMIGFTAQRLMELEVEGLTGAAHGERSPERINQRNGYRDRLWETVRLQMVWDNLSCLGTEALARLGVRLGGFQLMLQSSQFDGVAFDPFSF